MINNDECGVADDNLLCHTGSVSNPPWVLYGKGDERGSGVFCPRLLLPVENLIYRGLRIDKEEEMDLEEIFRVHSRIQRDEPGGAPGPFCAFKTCFPLIPREWAK